MRRLLLAVLWALALAAPGAHAQGPAPLERAREELGIERPLPSRWPLPNGDLEVGPSELLASDAGAPIRFTVRLERPEPGGAVSVDLPGTERGRSGLPGLRGPGRLEIRFAGEGLVHSATVDHVGLPAGTYALPLTWHDGRRAGSARLRVLAPSRERAAAPSPWRGMDVSADAQDQSEAFATVVPGDPRRIATASNPGASDTTLPAWLSIDGGATWGATRSRRPSTCRAARPRWPTRSAATRRSRRRRPATSGWARSRTPRGRRSRRGASSSTGCRGRAATASRRRAWACRSARWRCRTSR
jgi:hypothetical protein